MFHILLSSASKRELRQYGRLQAFIGWEGIYQARFQYYALLGSSKLLSLNDFQILYANDVEECLSVDKIICKLVPKPCSIEYEIK